MFCPIWEWHALSPRLRKIGNENEVMFTFESSILENNMFWTYGPGMYLGCTWVIWYAYKRETQHWSILNRAAFLLMIEFPMGKDLGTDKFGSTCSQNTTTYCKYCISNQFLARNFLSAPFFRKRPSAWFRLLSIVPLKTLFQTSQFWRNSWEAEREVVVWQDFWYEQAPSCVSQERACWEGIARNTLLFVFLCVQHAYRRPCCGSWWDGLLELGLGLGAQACCCIGVFCFLWSRFAKHIALAVLGLRQPGFLFFDASWSLQIRVLEVSCVTRSDHELCVRTRACHGMMLRILFWNLQRQGLSKGLFNIWWCLCSMHVQCMRTHPSIHPSTHTGGMLGEG